MDPAVLEALRRDSGLRLDREGVFHFHGRPVANERVQDLFHRGLAVRADGAVTLTVGPQWAYVECDSVARFIDGLRVTGGALEASLRDGAVVRASAPRVGVGPDERVYLWAGPTDIPAVLTRGAHHRLVELLEEDPATGVLYISLAEEGTKGAPCARVEVEQLAAVPGPGDRGPRAS